MEIKALADLRFIFLNAPKVIGTKLDPEAGECIRFADWFRGAIVAGDFSGIYFHVPNEGTYSTQKRPVFAAVQKAMGKINGAPDYVFMWGAGAGIIEFKRPDGKGKLSEEQQALQRICQRAGVNHAVCLSAEEARDALISWGALKGNVIKVPSLTANG